MIRRRSFLVLVLAAASLGMTRQESGGPRSPITARTGPNGFPTGPRGFSSFSGGGSGILFSFQDGKLRLLAPGTANGFGVEDLRLELPAMIDAHDEGAIAATAEIVALRNPIGPSRSSPTMAPAPPAAMSLAPGELYLRIHKPASIQGRRADVPANAFAARAMSPVPFRTFQPRGD